MRHGAKNVRQGAENVRYVAEILRHGAENMRYGPKMCSMVAKMCGMLLKMCGMVPKMWGMVPEMCKSAQKCDDNQPHKYRAFQIFQSMAGLGRFGQSGVRQCQVPISNGLGFMVF